MARRFLPPPSPLLHPPLVVACCCACCRRNRRVIEEEIAPLPSSSSSSIIASTLPRCVTAFATAAIEERSRSNRGGLRKRVVVILFLEEGDSPPCPVVYNVNQGESFSSYFARRTMILPFLRGCLRPQLRTSTVPKWMTRVLLLLVYHNQRDKEEDTPSPSSTVFSRRHALL